MDIENNWGDLVSALEDKIRAKASSVRTLLSGIAALASRAEEIRDAHGQGHTSYAADYVDRETRFEWAGLHKAWMVAENVYGQVCRDENRAYKKFMKQLKKGTAK